MNIRNIEGKYSTARVYTTENAATAIDDYAVAQLQMLCDNEASNDSVIRVMPDVHPGKVCTIGLTMTITDRVMPQIIGIDIGCGMTTYMVKALLSLGTLGGGNHFIECGTDDDSNIYITVHSGSRHLGKEVTDYYMSEGQKVLKVQNISTPYELTFLTENLMNDYIHDLEIVQKFADLNRHIILNEICKGMKWKKLNEINCIHNYIDTRPETATALVYNKAGNDE